MIFGDDKERECWISVYSSTISGGWDLASRTADRSVELFRKRNGRDLEDENVRLRRELTELRAKYEDLVNQNLHGSFEK